MINENNNIEIIDENIWPFRGEALQYKIQTHAWLLSLINKRRLFVPFLTSSSNMYEGSSFRTFSEMSTSLRWVFQKMEMVSGRNSIWLFEALQICCGVTYLGLSSFANKKKINMPFIEHKTQHGQNIHACNTLPMFPEIVIVIPA